MNPIDIILVIVAIGYGIAGFRQGFVVGALGVVGLIAGGVLGVWLAPYLLEQFEPSMTVSLVALFGVIALALLGQTLGAVWGETIRRRVTWRPAHAVDAGAGAVLSVAALLVVVWILGAAVAGAHLGDLSRYVRTSSILTTVDRVMPREAERALLAFSQVVDPGVFPQFLEPFAPERIAPARPPDAAILADPDVERASDSVVKVNGLAMRCGRSLSGSGFVYARGRVMTNAHVVAGVRSPQVETSDGETYDADVVLYDPQRDVAVLRVPDLPEDPLRLDDSAEPHDSGVVLGYPGNGELRAAPARIRSEQRLRGPDIYGEQQVVREVLSLYAEVRPGNSGGPLISSSGTVTGLIFAASVEDSATGYALTVDEIAADARQGADSRTPVDTGACA